MRFPVSPELVDPTLLCVRISGWNYSVSIHVWGHIFNPGSIGIGKKDNYPLLNS